MRKCFLFFHLGKHLKKRFRRRKKNISVKKISRKIFFFPFVIRVKKKLIIIIIYVKLRKEKLKNSPR